MKLDFHALMEGENMKSGRFISQQTFDLDEFSLLKNFEECRFVKWFARKYVWRTQVLPKYVFRVSSDWVHPNYDVYLFADTNDNFCIIAGRHPAVQLHRREIECLYKEYLAE